MNHKNRLGKYLNKTDYDIFSDSDTVSSSTECTGLIPTPPYTDFESESYSELYNIPKQQDFND